MPERATARLIEPRSGLDIRSILGDAVCALSEDERAVLVRYKYGKYDLSQIARTLKVSETFARRRLFSAYEKLVTGLAPLMSETPSSAEPGLQAWAEAAADPVIKLNRSGTVRQEAEDGIAGSSGAHRSDGAVRVR